MEKDKTELDGVKVICYLRSAGVKYANANLNPWKTRFRTVHGGRLAAHFQY